MNKRSNQHGYIDFEMIFGGVIALVIIAAIIGAIWSTIAWNQHHTMTCVVDTKQATAKSGGGNQYLIYTKNCGQLQVADSITQGKFNSTDTYAAIKEGHSYTFDTVGWRNGFFSAYPNILEVTE